MFGNKDGWIYQIKRHDKTESDDSSDDKETTVINNDYGENDFLFLGISLQPSCIFSEIICKLR